MHTKGIVRILFVVTGLFLISLSYILQAKNQSLFSDIIKDFAVVLLSIVILDIIWNAVGGELNQKGLDKIGISKVYLSPAEINDIKWIDIIKKTSTRIDLQGLTISDLAKNKDIMMALKEKIISGVKVRVIIMSPDHWHLSSSGHKNFIYPHDIISLSKSTTQIFENLRSELKDIKSQKGEFTFVLNKTKPISISIRRFDDELYVLHYISNMDTLNTPVYLIKGKNQELFQVYLESFEKQYNDLVHS